MIRTVLVDTGGWVGYFDRRDSYHAEAVRAFEQAQEERLNLMTTDLVLVETVTLMRRRAGLEAALRAWTELEQETLADLFRVQPQDMARGRAAMRKHGQIALSAVDSVSIAVMRHLGVSTILTFDNDFRKAGFIMLPSPDGRDLSHRPAR